jgi:hypothetical protein
MLKHVKLSAQDLLIIERKWNKITRKLSFLSRGAQELTLELHTSVTAFNCMSFFKGKDRIYTPFMAGKYTCTTKHSLHQ